MKNLTRDTRVSMLLPLIQKQMLQSMRIIALNISVYFQKTFLLHYFLNAMKDKKEEM